MFAAVGYTSLVALRDEIEKLAFEFSTEQSGERSLFQPHDKSSALLEDFPGFLSTSSETLSLIEFTKLYLIDYLLVQQPRPIYLSSLSGQLVTASKHFFVSRANLSRSNFEWPFDDESELSQIFGQFRKHQATACDFEYPLISTETWMVRSLSQSEIGLYTAELGPIAEVIFPMAVHFSEWAVCIHESDKADLVEKLRGALFVKNCTVGNNSGGRPSVRQEAARIYRELYPRGHDASGVFWKQAEHEVGLLLGKKVSALTIKRGLDELPDS